MSRIAVGLGSSLGPRRRQLERAIRLLNARPGIALWRCSRWYLTPPMRGGTARGWFLNGVAVFHTDLDPHAFLAECIRLEVRSGRRRARYWGDRTLDLDVLLVDDQITQSDDLQVPHPAIARRPFVLIPLVEAWPEARDPISGRLLADIPIPAGPRPVPVGVVARRASAD